MIIRISPLNNLILLKYTKLAYWLVMRERERETDSERERERERERQRDREIVLKIPLRPPHSSIH